MNFSLNDVEWKRFEKWVETNEEHQKCRTAYTGAIGGLYTYMFSPNSIGCGVSVSCGLCKQTVNVTDYEDW